MDKIVRIAGYSKKDDEHNPAIKEFVNAFRGYKSKNRMKGMKPKPLDYIAFMFMAMGILAIIIGIAIIPLFITGWIFITIGMILSFISSGLNDWS